MRQAALLALLLPLPALAETASIPYDKLARLQAMFDNIPQQQRSLLQFAALVTHADPSRHGPIRLWVDWHTQHVDIPVAPDGEIALPRRRDWSGQGVRLQTDQPAHSLMLDASLMLVPPKSQVIPMSYLRDGAAQAQRALRSGARQLGGYLAQFAAPTLTGLNVTLPGCCHGTATLHAAAGDTVLKQAADGALVVKLNQLEDSSGTVAFSAAISKIDVSTD